MNGLDTLKTENGRLIIGGMDAKEIAAEYGTPVYVYDEAHIRAMINVFKSALSDFYGGYGMILYASKAFACSAIYRVMQSEKAGVDVVSGGELYTALKAGVLPQNIYLHGNNKLYNELKLAVESGVGTVVLDSFDEADILDSIANELGVVQNVIIRVNPGIEAHTHEFIQTAKTDSKFGFSVDGGCAEQITEYVLMKKNLILSGFHCHIGSQIFEKKSFALAAEKMLDFIADIKAKSGYEAAVLNMGGGFGIRYTGSDPKLGADDYRAYVKSISDAIKDKCGVYGLKLPYLVLEPGRSVVGEAGITLYTVGTVKEIAGIKTYVAVDGGMFENPRYALYRADYSALIVDRADENCTQKVTIAGKCCESGDVIAADVNLPQVKRGDVIAVLSTGAYNYSMASNYNRNPIPPVIFVKNGKAEYVVKPQSYEDIVRNDIIPERLKQ